MSPETETISELLVIIDAIQLFKQDITPENQEELIDKYVALIDPNGFGSPFGDPNKDQLSKIYEGGEMIWTIKTLREYAEEEEDIEGEESYKAFLEAMEQEIDPESKSYFKEGNPIYVNGRNQIIGNVVTDHKMKNGNTEGYVLRFHITKGDEFKFSMTIDPKLQIRKKEIGN